MKKPMFVIMIFLVLIICNQGRNISDNSSVNKSKRPMTVTDAINIKNIKNILISPDGKEIFYSVESADLKENEMEIKHFLCNAEGENTQEILKDYSEAERIRFSSNGKYLTFLYDVKTDSTSESIDKKEKNNQVYIYKIETGDAEQITNHSVSINSYAWFKDDAGIIFTADAVKTPEERQEYEEGTVGIFIDEKSNGRSRIRYTQIWYKDIEKDTEELICDKDLVISEFAISNDGEKIVFIGRPDGRTNYPHLAEVYLVNSDGSGFMQLTKNGSPEEEVSWSPDNETIIFNAPYRTINEKKFILSVGYFWVYNTSTGESYRLESKHSGESIGGTKAWSPDGKYYYYHELVGTNTNLYRIEVKSDQFEQLSHFEGSIYPKSFSEDFSKMVYTYEDHKTPADIYISDPELKSSIQITDLNPWVKNEILLSAAKPVKWVSSKDNLEIEGMFYSPAVQQSANKTKLLVHIHGGPMGVVENRFRPRMHVYGGLGYAVLAPNFRGSTGYGDKIICGLKGEVGDGEHCDILSGVDYVIKNYNIDPDKMAVRGWSWGGVSTGFLITHCHRFKAASAGAGVYNWIAEHGPGFCYDMWHWYFGEASWKNPKVWRDRSAINYAENVKTPLILFHGDADEAASSNQSLMYFSTLKEINKIPVRYIMFPDQEHSFSDPKALKMEMTEEIRWIRKYVEELY